MAIPTMDEAVQRINRSIERKKASFELIQIPKGNFGLAVGSYRAVKVRDGFVVSMRLSIEQMEYLKGQLEEALAQKR